MRSQTWLSRAVVMGALLALCACGSDNPAAPSAATRVLLKGTVLGAPTSVFTESAASTQSASGGKITATVQEAPSLTVTVSGNGTFEISGLPLGSFTLVFSRDGVVLGTVAVTGVQPDVEITLVVKVTGNNVVLVSLKMGDGPDQVADDPGQGNAKACMIEGGKVGRGIELEGNVDSGNSSHFKMNVNGNRSGGLVDVNANGASFQCKGDKTSSSECKASVKSGAKVHVSGSLDSCSQSAAQVTASQVKVQK